MLSSAMGLRVQSVGCRTNSWPGKRLFQRECISNAAGAEGRAKLVDRADRLVFCSQ